MDKSKVIILPDGYNGHTYRYYADPVYKEKSAVILRCAEEGKEYMTRWCHLETYLNAMKNIMVKP